MLLAPPSLHRVPVGRVPRTRRYYAALRLLATHPAALRCLRLAVPPQCPVLRPTPPGHPQREDLEDWSTGPPCRYVCLGGNDEISQVPGEPHCTHAALSDPGGTSVPGHSRHLGGARRLTATCGLPLKPQRRPPQSVRFRGSITRPTCSLSTLRSAPHGHTTQDSLPRARPSPRAGLHLPGFHSTISVPLPTSPPSRPSFLAHG